MFKNIKKFINKNLKSILTIFTITIVMIMMIIAASRPSTKENYSGMSNQNGGAGNTYENQEGLYKSDIGIVGTRKDFSQMRKPHLNPIIVPVVKGVTE